MLPRLIWLSIKLAHNTKSPPFELESPLKTPIENSECEMETEQAPRTTYLIQKKKKKTEQNNISPWDIYGLLLAQK